MDVTKIDEKKFNKLIEFLLRDGRFNLHIAHTETLINGYEMTTYYFTCNRGSARCVLIRFLDGTCYVNR